MIGRVAFGATALLGAIVLGYSPIRSLVSRKEAVDVALLRVTRSTITESTVALGTIRPTVGAEVKVGSQLSGVVQKLSVNVGDTVSKGDVLASLRDADWRARVDVLRAGLAAAVAERDFAAGDLARRERMRDLIPLQDLEDARKRLEVTRAEVDRARADVSQAAITLGYSVIRAPVSGTVASVSTYEGETVAASLAAPTFLTIIDLGRLEVQAYVDENDIGRVHTGQPVAFRVDAFPGQELEGVVQAIYPKAQLVGNVVNYIVIVRITNSRGMQVRPEMTVHVDFVLARKEGALTIPRSALLRREGKGVVLVRTQEGWIERPVTTGIETPQSVEIVAGIREGEAVVADTQAWKEGMEEKR